MKPYLHAKSSVNKWGGTTDDYLPIHDFLDCSKAAHADMRHRAVLHNSLGPYIAEQCFGHNITNSAGKEVSVRDICEQHIIEDLDRIPSLSQWLAGMPMYWWMGGTRGRKGERIVD